MNTSATHNILEARALAIFGDDINTEQIATNSASPFNSPDLQNFMTPGIGGGYTQYFGDAPVPVPDQEISALPLAQPTYIHEASVAYQQTGRKLIIIAGDDYGSGTSHEQAVKTTIGLGIKAIIASSFDPHHRNQLIDSGILPLSFKDKADYQKIKGMPSCIFSITDLTGELNPMQEATLTATCGFTCPLILRLETSNEVERYLNSNSLSSSLKKIMGKAEEKSSCSTDGGG